MIDTAGVIPAPVHTSTTNANRKHRNSERGAKRVSLTYMLKIGTRRGHLLPDIVNKC